MPKTPQVVDGEASESDSEIEIGKTPDVEISEGTSNLQGSVIAGEASESDDDDVPASPAFRQLTPPPAATPPILQAYKDSILHQRLWEVNVSMRRNVEVLGLHTIRLAFEKMSGLNRELLAVQESIRVADSQVTLARARSRQFKKLLKDCHIQTALPNVIYE